jgi:hypothetical protein
MKAEKIGKAINAIMSENSMSKKMASNRGENGVSVGENESIENNRKRQRGGGSAAWQW